MRGPSQHGGGPSPRGGGEEGLPTWLRGALGVGPASARLAGAASGDPTSSCWSLPFAFLRTTDHPRQVSRCAVSTAAMGDPETFLCRSFWWHSTPRCRGKHWLLSMTVAPGATAAHVRVCVHACTWTCVCACGCVLARGPVCVCYAAGLKGKGLCSLVSGEPGDQLVIELQDGCRASGVGVGVGLGEAWLLPQGCPARPGPARMLIRVSMWPHLSHTLGCVCRARSLWGAGLRGSRCPQAGRGCPQAGFQGQLPSCSSEPQSSS